MAVVLLSAREFSGVIKAEKPACMLSKHLVNGDDVGSDGFRSKSEGSVQLRM